MSRKRLLQAGLVLAILIQQSTATAEPRVTYVGDGRYACSGSTRECEPILRRNESLEIQRRQRAALERQRQEMESQREQIRSEQYRLDEQRGSRR